MRLSIHAVTMRNPLRFAEDYTALSPQTFNILPDTDFQQEHLLQMVQELPPGYRCIFNLRCLEDFSYAEIAGHLGLSRQTVPGHIKSIYRKLEVHTRGEAVFEAVQQGLIKL